MLRGLYWESLGFCWEAKGATTPSAVFLACVVPDASFFSAHKVLTVMIGSQHAPDMISLVCLRCHDQAEFVQWHPLIFSWRSLFRLSSCGH